MSLRGRTFFIAALLTSTLMGCRARYRQVVAIDPKLQVSCVAIYPFGFRWQEGAYRSFELSQQLVEVAIAKAGSQAMIFGPSEFRVFRPQDDNAWAASTVASLLAAYGLSIHQAVILRPWAEKRVATRQAEAAAHDKLRGLHVVQETTYVGHVEIVHPSSRETLVDESGTVVVDPFADHSDDPDPAPELTELMRALTGDALRALGDIWRPTAEPVDLPLKYEIIPHEVFTYAEPGRADLEHELAKADALEADVMRLTRARYANPGIPDAEASKLLKLKSGLLVTQAPEGAQVAPGDVLHLIDGQPALPELLQRLRFSKARVRVNVHKPNGQSVDVDLP